MKISVHRDPQRSRPEAVSTQIKKLFIAGPQVDLSNKQTRLYEKYMNRP